MKPFLTLLTFLTLASLACTQVVVTPTPPAPSATSAATAVPVTATQSPTAAADPDTAIVIQPVVNIHETPGGIVRTDVWLTAGQEVEILGYDKSGDWARIAEGWVWGGCLEGVSDRECRADE
jgi:hypothetical protein